MTTSLLPKEALIKSLSDFTLALYEKISKIRSCDLISVSLTLCIFHFTYSLSKPSTYFYFFHQICHVLIGHSTPFLPKTPAPADDLEKIPFLQKS